jgi:5,10-methylenetetrahydromethanopterin reductase
MNMAPRPLLWPAIIRMPPISVLDDGEDVQSGRVGAAGGPGLVLACHGADELNRLLPGLPGGTEWQAVIDRTPLVERHLAVPDQHRVSLNEAAWDAAGYAMLEQATLSGTADQRRARLRDLAHVGVTELVYRPSGPDIRRELEVFMTAAKPAAAA